MRQFRHVLEQADHLETIDIGHDKVGDDDVRLVQADLDEALVTVTGGDDTRLAVVQLDMLAVEAHLLFIVFHDHHREGRVCRGGTEIRLAAVQHGFHGSARDAPVPAAGTPGL